MDHWLQRDTLSVVALFDDASGCQKFAQRVLRFGSGASQPRRSGPSDEVLYVLEGGGTATVGREEVPLRPGVGLFVRGDTEWAIESNGQLELLSVLVHDPEPASQPLAVVDLAGEGRRDATASRQFALGVRAETGCPSVTQFIGFVPPGRAPDHYHRYDEVLYVLEGEGRLHIQDDVRPLGPGACVHLPATLVHCLENTGDSELLLLGVFRPSGSPAEAYYPDGTLAVYPG